MFAKSKLHLFLLLLTVAALGLPLRSLAQDAATEPDSAPTEETTPAPGSNPEQEPVTIEDPEIPLDHLNLFLDPLTAEELGTEAEAWRGLLKEKMLEIAETEISARSGDTADAAPAGQDRTALLASLSELREQKTAIADRLKAVLDEWDAKGGDSSEYRSYLEAVAGIKVDVYDAEATLAALTGWLKSKEGGIKWAINAGKFLVIMLIFWVLARILGGLVKRATERQTKLSGLLKAFINKLVRRVVLFIGLLVALSTLGVNVGAMFALIGGGAFIIGFALQDTLGNFAAGLMLLIYRPFDTGDVVEIADVSGKVDSVSLVSTTIRTFDNKVVLVPNKEVWGQVITNATASDERRVDLVFGIGYEDDIEKAQTILERLVSEHELTLETPEPTIKLHELADSSVNFICRPWSKTADYWTVYWDLTRKVKETFDAEGISIPFPQRDIHLIQQAEDKA